MRPSWPGTSWSVCVVSHCVFVSHQCPIDTRKVLSENLVIIGGTAMLPGFLHRLLAEIRSLVEKPKYCNALATKNFRIHSPPAKPSCTAWLGGTRTFAPNEPQHSFNRLILQPILRLMLFFVFAGAIFGALQDILGSRSVSRDYYNQTGRIPDWCCLSSPPPDSVYEAGKTPPPLMKRAFSTEKWTTACYRTVLSSICLLIQRCFCMRFLFCNVLLFLSPSDLSAAL